MSIIKVASLICDSCGRVLEVASRWDRPGALRRIARGRGWSVDLPGRRDECLSCYVPVISMGEARRIADRKEMAK